MNRVESRILWVRISPIHAISLEEIVNKAFDSPGIIDKPLLNILMLMVCLTIMAERHEITMNNMHGNGSAFRGDE